MLTRHVETLVAVIMHTIILVFFILVDKSKASDQV